MCEYEVYAKGMSWSDGHNTNMIGNLSRVLGYYTDGNPVYFSN